MTLTFISSMPHPNKACNFLPHLLIKPSYNYTTEHKDDSQIIPRSSSVTVKRLPAARPGKGKASMYVAGAPQPTPRFVQSSQPPAPSKGDEAAAMAAMFQAQSQNWEQAQEKMSQLVLPIAGFCLRSSPQSNDECFLSFVFFLLRLFH